MIGLMVSSAPSGPVRPPVYRGARDSEGSLLMALFSGYSRNLAKMNP